MTVATLPPAALTTEQAVTRYWTLRRLLRERAIDQGGVA
jgi:hypothetical protein